MTRWDHTSETFGGGETLPPIAAGALCCECTRLRTRRGMSSTHFMTPNLATHVRRTLRGESKRPGVGSIAPWWHTEPLCRWHATEATDAIVYTLAEYNEQRAGARVLAALEGRQRG